MHPIFGTLLRRPDLLAAHLGNYVALVREETAASLRGVAVRAAAGATAAVLGITALNLTGIAVMLGVMQDRFDWVLVIVPGIAWVLTAIGAVVAMRPIQVSTFEDIKTQVRTDRAALQVAGEIHDRDR